MWGRHQLLAFVTIPRAAYCKKLWNAALAVEGGAAEDSPHAGDDIQGWYQNNE
jgi:hypothetical protein